MGAKTHVMHVSNSIIKYADDTTVGGLITSNNETAYWEVRALGEWCLENYFSHNINKTKELIVDYRRQQREHAHIYIEWRGSKASSSSAYTSLRTRNGTFTQRGEEGSTAG